MLACARASFTNSRHDILFPKLSICRNNNTSFLNEVQNFYGRPSIEKRSAKSRYSSNKKPNYKMPRGKYNNPFVALFKSQSSTGSLLIPEIQTVFDIITTGASSIFSSTSDVLLDALINIQTSVDDDLSNLLPQVETMLSKSNTTMVTNIRNAFQNSLADFTSDIQALASNLNSNTSDRLNEHIKSLLNQVNNRINSTTPLVASSVNNGTTASIENVLSALTLANSDLYDQFFSLLENSQSSSPISEKLKYADSSAITNILSSDNNAIYNNIENLLNAAISDIQGYINAATAEKLTEDTEILANTCTKIITALENRITNTLLPAIQQSIADATIDESTQLTSLLVSDTSSLKVNINNIIDQLTPAIAGIINDVTSSQITAMTSFLARNNDSTLAQTFIIYENP